MIIFENRLHAVRFARIAVPVVAFFTLVAVNPIWALYLLVGAGLGGMAITLLFAMWDDTAPSNDNRRRRR